MSHECDHSWPWQGTWGDCSSSPGNPCKILAGRVERLRLSGVGLYIHGPADSFWEHVLLLFLCHECNFWTVKEYGKTNIHINIIFARTIWLLVVGVHDSHYEDFCDKSHLCLQLTLGLEQHMILQSESVWKKNINIQTQNRINIYFVFKLHYVKKACTGWSVSSKFISNWDSNERFL